MMEEKLVSIGWTTHHEPIEMVQKSLDSLDCQTYENCEFILVNDCSEIEGMNEFLSYYVKTHKRFRYIQLNENVGFIKAKNICAMSAKGEYFGWMDADQEFIGQDCITIMVETLDNNSNCISTAIPSKEDTETDALWHYWRYDSNYSYVNIGTALFRKDIFEKIGYVLELRYGEVDFIIHMLKYQIDNNLTSLCSYMDGNYLINKTTTNRGSNDLGIKGIQPNYYDKYFN